MSLFAHSSEIISVPLLFVSVFIHVAGGRILCPGFPVTIWLWANLKPPFKASGNDLRDMQPVEEQQLLRPSPGWIWLRGPLLLCPCFWSRGSAQLATAEAPRPRGPARAGKQWRHIRQGKPDLSCCSSCYMIIKNIVYSASPAGSVQHLALYSIKASGFSRKCKFSFFVDLRPF